MPATSCCVFTGSFIHKFSHFVVVHFSVRCLTSSGNSGRSSPFGGDLCGHQQAFSQGLGGIRLSGRQVDCSLPSFVPEWITLRVFWLMRMFALSFRTGFDRAL
ncbi:hypothetical protein RSAG8_01378, partial [Rhizoctonia solani AG-8 WAC10335]